VLDDAISGLHHALGLAALGALRQSETELQTTVSYQQDQAFAPRLCHA
jgi:hypothetical protein